MTNVTNVTKRRVGSQAVSAVINGPTPGGHRDREVFTFLYNVGVRAGGIVNLKAVAYPENWPVKATFTSPLLSVGLVGAEYQGTRANST